LSTEFAESVKSSVKSTPPVPPVPGSGESVLLLLHDAKKGANITVPADTPRTVKNWFLFILFNLNG
jgi:hypothetical protein